MGEPTRGERKVPTEKTQLECVTQVYTWVVVPDFETSGLLPPGIHLVTWAELDSQFGFSQRRLALLEGLALGLASLREAGCQTVYVDGSFASAKVSPGDFDVCWELTGVDPEVLDPVLLEFSGGRAAQKAKYGGEFFPAEWAAVPDGTAYLEFFQTDKLSGERKGILKLSLTENL